MGGGGGRERKETTGSAEVKLGSLILCVCVCCVQPQRCTSGLFHWRFAESESGSSGFRVIRATWIPSLGNHRVTRCIRISQRIPEHLLNLESLVSFVVVVVILEMEEMREGAGLVSACRRSA